MPYGPSAHEARLAVEQAAEDARRVEGGEAEPVDRPVGRDEGARVAVREERVVRDRRERRGCGGALLRRRVGLRVAHCVTQGPCQRPKPATSSSAPSGPHEPGAYGVDRRRRVEERLHDPPRLLDPVLPREARVVADHRRVEQDLVGGRPLPALIRELHVELDGSGGGARRVRPVRVGDDPDPHRRIELDHDLVRLRLAEAEAELGRALEDHADLGLRRREALAGADEERHARPAPVLDLEPERRVRLGRRVGGDAVDPEVAVVLAAHVVRRVALGDGLEERDIRVLQRPRVAARRRLHRRRRDHLHQVVDDDVAQRADRVVEVAPVLHAEVLGHRDLDARDVVPVPDRLEQRVGEPDVEDLLEPHLPEVVVDPEELRLVDVLVQLGGERAGGLLVVPEGLLDDDPGALRQPGAVEALDHAPEEERRDLEVEDGVLGVPDGRGDPLVGGVVGEVALDVREPLGEAREHGLVELLAGADDRVACTLHELVDRPVVEGDPDDRALQQAALLEPVQRPERHHLGQVARDPEDHEDVGHLRGRRRRRCGCGCGARHLFLLP